MADDDRIYKDEHRQLSRIATYSAIFSKIPLLLMLIFLAILIAMIVAYGRWPFGAVIGAFVLLVLGFNLWTRHRLCCPKCKQPFFGKFKLFAPYIDHCQNCGFCIIRGKPIKLDLEDM